MGFAVAVFGRGLGAAAGSAGCAAHCTRSGRTHAEPADADRESIRNGPGAPNACRTKPTMSSGEDYSLVGGGTRTARRSGLVRAAVIVASVLLAAVAVAVVVALVVRSRHDDSNDNDDGLEKFHFDHIFNSSFTPFSISPQWVAGGAAYTYVASDGRVRIRDVAAGTDELLFDPSVIGQKSIAAHSLSPDRRAILVATDSHKVWRHSFLATYHVVDLASGAKAQVGDAGAVQAAVWSPSASATIAFVMRNNVFLYSNGTTTAVSTDGNDSVLNGVNGWLYEEEVFSDSPVLWWSPSGDSLAWFRTDETNVPVYPMSKYLVPGTVIPQIQNIRYPKPGQQNPQVTLLVRNIRNGTTVSADATAGDYYASAVAWQDDEVVIVRKLNRHQDAEVLLFVNATSGATRELQSRTAKGWLEEKIGVNVVQGTEWIVEIVVKGQFPQIVIRSAVTGEERQLTNNNFATTDYVGFSAENNAIIYQAAPIQTDRFLYTVGLDGNNNRLLFTLEAGSTEAWWSASCAHPCKYLFITNGGPGIPNQTVASFATANQRTVVNDNAALHTFMSHFRLPSTRYFTARDATGTQDLSGWAMYPPKFSESKKYPVLFYVYGGPGSQLVNKAFYTNWFHYYLATKGFIVVTVDPRGTIARNDDFIKQVYLRGGVAAAEDIIAAAKQFKQHSYVKSKNVGIWGWSFGGYTTSMVMTSPGVSEAFSTGVSVAPVTDWGFYDTCYTERFMRTQLENPEGYNATSVMRRAKNLVGNYLLVHGTGDDNVHFMNSCVFNEALVEAGVQFSAMWYSDRDHAINGNNARQHLYRLIDNFVSRHLHN
eukprot:m51a1_g3050 hypothetical protein (821) ;mRNA; r:949257-952570